MIGVISGYRAIVNNKTIYSSIRNDIIIKKENILEYRKLFKKIASNITGNNNIIIDLIYEISENR